MGNLRFGLDIRCKTLKKNNLGFELSSSRFLELWKQRSQGQLLSFLSSHGHNFQCLEGLHKSLKSFNILRDFYNTLPNIILCLSHNVILGRLLRLPNFFYFNLLYSVGKVKFNKTKFVGFLLIIQHTLIYKILYCMVHVIKKIYEAYGGNFQ